jgi:hypothetical protein
MAVELRLASDELAEDEVQQLTEELAETLEREAGVEASLPQNAPRPGAKGDPITIGVLLLGMISSGSVVAMFNSLSAFFHRSKKLEISVTGKDGRSITLKSENVSEEERERTLSQLRPLLED